MVRRKSPNRTESELSILGVLWRRGPLTVRRVHDEISREKPSGYTTTLKLLQIMHAKGLVRRDETGRSHVYRALIPEAQTQQTLLDGLLGRAFGGSLQKLVMRALSVRKSSPEELAEIRTFLDQLERKQGKAKKKE